MYCDMFTEEYESEENCLRRQRLGANIPEYYPVTKTEGEKLIKYLDELPETAFSSILPQPHQVI